MDKKINVEIIVTNEFGQQYSEMFRSDKYDKIYNTEWSEITRGLIDEAVSTKEL